MGGKGGYFAAKSGKIRGKSDIEAVSGARLVATSSALSTDTDHVFVHNNAVRLATWNGGSGGFWQKRISQNGQPLIIVLVDGTNGGPDTAAAVSFKAIEANQVNGLATGMQLELYGANPVPKPAAIASPAADVAALKAAVDATRTTMTALGLTS